MKFKLLALSLALAGVQVTNAAQWDYPSAAVTVTNKPKRFATYKTITLALANSSFAIKPVLSLEIITTLMCGSMVSINRNALLCCRLTKTANRAYFQKP